MMDDRRRTVAIVGAGASGSLLGCQLYKQNRAVRVLLIEPGPVVGVGVAYGTPCVRHLLNVPAGKISALPDRPEHFLHWLQEHHDRDAHVDTFASRMVFGEYLRSLLASASGVEQIKGTVHDCRMQGTGACLSISGGRQVQADVVVLAVGNLEPKQVPGVQAAAVANGTYCNNAWASDTYADLKNNSSVVLIGTGLTSIDVLLRLRELKHQGTVTALSRRGSFPARHAPHEIPAQPVLPPNEEPKTTCHLLRTFRAALSSGVQWRGAIDSLRPISNELWLGMPLIEQQRFRRHLQRRWDVLRHRMAPCIADTLDGELAAGSLKVCQGHVVQVKAITTLEAEVRIQTRRGEETIPANRVINCTGPNLDYRTSDSPLLQSLFARKLVEAGPLGSGLSCDASGALRSADGKTSRVLFTLGPGRQGVFFESIAIPEIAQQAADLAQIIVHNLAHSNE